MLRTTSVAVNLVGVYAGSIHSLGRQIQSAKNAERNNWKVFAVLRMKIKLVLNEILIIAAVDWIK